MVNKSKVKSVTSPASSWWNERNRILASIKKAKPTKTRHKAKKVKAKKPTKAKKAMKTKKVAKTGKITKKSKRSRR